MKPPSLVIAAGIWLISTFGVAAEVGLLAHPHEANFPLVAKQSPATFLVETTSDYPVSRAANDLRGDIGQVTGLTPGLDSELPLTSADAVVIVGVQGKSAVLQQLADSGKIDLQPLRGAWESFIIAVVDRPLPHIRKALVIAGSDNRGAIYGCYEISEAIGVSPWHWWADVHPDKKAELFIAGDVRRFGPPSVKYRGIFINDEDWGLQPWAARTFEPETGDIGPKTYAKVFELLLRLKANTLWPAMHPSTRPFNAFPDNKEVARRYGIVMGSSHAEPMLRNNVGEWKEPPEGYNYQENREGVLRYWEQRVRENGAYENIYTLGMRGIHDTGMQGSASQADRIKLLEKIFADQRALLARHVRPDVEQVPQMFCAYKEVLDLYRGGLRVPDDVTIVWPDDNHGYIRNFSTAAEQRRKGGAGVYYHLSYLGAPMSYLWLSTIPPALIWEEMTKAYDHGARTLWIANAGDIKPAEIGIDFFLRLAWDVKSWSRSTLPDYLPQWAARNFGPGPATEIGAILQEYYQLNFQRKPEHLQWWLPQSPQARSPFTTDEADARLHAFATLQARVERVAATIPDNRRDAFHQLVAYPVVGSALANERYFSGERASAGGPDAAAWLARARRADERIRRETTRYNNEMSGGKWKGLMQLDVAEGEWPQFQIESWRPPADVPERPRTRASAQNTIVVEAENYTRKVDRPGAAWERIPGLGRTGPGSVAMFPTTADSIAASALAQAAPRLEYPIELPAPGEYTVQVHLVPTHPLRAGTGLRLALAVDDGPPREVIVAVKDGSPDWAQGVLNATVVGRMQWQFDRAGPHTLHLLGADAGVVVDSIVITKDAAHLGYLATP